MKQKKRIANSLTRDGLGLLVILMALCLLALGAPVQAQDGLAYTAWFTSRSADHDSISTADGTQLVMGNAETFIPVLSFNPGLGAAIGTGVYRILDEEGREIKSGTWVVEGLVPWAPWRSIGKCLDSAACLEMFGPSASHFEAGVMRAFVSFEGIGVAILTVWCSLPGIPALYMGNPTETFRVRLQDRAGVLGDPGHVYYFNEAADQTRGTLFTRIIDGG